MTPAVEVAVQEWNEGARRLEELELPSARMAVIRGVVAEIAAELERRMGQTFTLAELADEYAGAAAWCLDVAQRTAPQPWAHDLSVVQGAAFARLARNATDFR
ncbi:MAG TPA: hypothetical protein VE777_02595 [Gaiellales bacterium]|nr:hypothetical protein [Gaiellales bacterium]